VSAAERRNAFNSALDELKSSLGSSSEGVTKNPTLNAASSSFNTHITQQYATPTPEMQAKGWNGDISAKRFSQTFRNIVKSPSQDPTPRHAVVATPTLRWEDLNRAERKHITKHMESLGITGKSVSDMAGAHLDAALNRHLEGGTHPDQASATLPGRDWYLNEGSEVAARAVAQGSDPAKTIDAAAIISPATPWQNQAGTKVNADIALKIAKTADPKNTEPLTITQEQVNHIKADAAARPLSHNAYDVNHGVPHDSWVGTKPVNERSAKEIATIGGMSNPTTEKTMIVRRGDENVELPRTNFAADIYDTGAKAEPSLSYIAETKGRREVGTAIDVIRGNKNAEDALPQSSPKPRSFRANLQAPYDHPGTRTIDRWDQRQLMGKELGSSVPKIPKTAASHTEMTASGNSKMVTPPGVRAHMVGLIHDQGANAFLQHHAAKASTERGLPISSEAQSIGWIQRKGMVEGFGQFGDNRDSDPQKKAERLANTQQFDASVLGPRIAAKRYKAGK
jgi:hypothetical protein